MATVSIREKDIKVSLPDVCPVCLMPATKSLPVQHVFNVVVVSQSFTLEHRYCDKHYEEYKQSLFVEKLIGSVLMVVGAVGGTLGLAWFGRFAAGYTHPAILIFLGVAGAGGGLVIALQIQSFLRMFQYYLVPSRYKAVHDALRVKEFNVAPDMHGMRLNRIIFTSSNEEYARLLAEANQVKVEY